MSKLRGLVLRGSVFRMVMLFANIAVAFYMMPFLIHSLGDRWYGMWTLVATFMGYYGYLDFGLSISVQRFIARAIGKEDQEEVNKTVSTALFLFIIIGIIVLIISLIIAAMSPIFFSDSEEISIFRIVMVVMGLNVAITFMMAPVNGLMTGNLRYDIATGINMGKLAIRTALIIYFIMLGYSIIALACITLLADVGGNLVKIIIAKKIFKGIEVKRKLYSADLLKSLFGYGGKTFVNQLADLMRFGLDHLVIAAFINLSAVTLYNIASQLVYYFRSFIGSLTGVLTPVYARYQAAEDSEMIYKTYYFTSKIAALISVLTGGAAIIFGRDFILIWMGRDYIEAYRLLTLLIVPTVLFVAQSPANSVIYGLGAVGILAKVSIIEAITNVVLSVALVGPLGLIGIALGTAIPLVFFSIFLLFLAIRLVGGNLSTYVRSVGPVFIVAITLQVIAWYVVSNQEISSYSDILVLILYIYPLQLILLTFLVFSPDERQIVFDAGRRALGINYEIGNEQDPGKM